MLYLDRSEVDFGTLQKVEEVLDVAVARPVVA
jgi:hypothetical protein